MGPTLVPAGPVSRSSLISWRYLFIYKYRKYRKSSTPSRRRSTTTRRKYKSCDRRRSPSRQSSRPRLSRSARTSITRPTGTRVFVNRVVYNRVEEDLKRSLTFQRSENTKLGQQISLIKQEKTMLQQNLLALQKRISELELQIGGE